MKSMKLKTKMRIMNVKTELHFLNNQISAIDSLPFLHRTM